MSYDQKCYDLASIFLGDEPDLLTDDHIVELAQTIQSAIEDYISSAKSEWEEANGQFGVGA